MNYLPHLHVFGYQGVVADVRLILEHEEYIAFKLEGELEAHCWTTLGGEVSRSRIYIYHPSSNQ